VLSFSFLFSYALNSFSISLSLFILLLKRTHRGSKKFYVLLTHHPFFFFFFFFFFCPCMYVCKAVFFFCHQHCLNYVTVYSMVKDNFFLVYECMNERQREKKKSKWGQIYVCMYVHISFFSHSFIEEKKEKKVIFLTEQVSLVP
jgi:hypothetical protein